MSLSPLPDEALIAADLRKMAADLILRAEALEAKVPQKPKKHVEFINSKKRRMERIASCR